MPAGRRLTQSMVDRLPFMDSGQTWHWDTQLRGFGVQVGRTTKSYVVQFRGKRSTIGRADRMTVDEARTKASEYIRAIERGEDPRAERIAVRSKAERLKALTLQIALDEALEAKAQFTRPKTLVDYRRMIECYLSSWIDQPLYLITTSDVVTV